MFDKANINSFPFLFKLEQAFAWADQLVSDSRLTLTLSEWKNTFWSNVKWSKHIVYVEAEVFEEITKKLLIVFDKYSKNY